MTAASLKFTTVTTSSGVPGSRTDYILGRNTRLEHGSRVQIHNRDLGYAFELDLTQKVYAAYRANQFGGPKWIEAIRRKPLKRSGRTTHVHIETIETEERTELFGYAARRVFTKNRATRDSQVMSESETDGWYIEPPMAWLALHSPPARGLFSYLSSGDEADDYKLTEAGRREDGFALVVRHTSRFFIQDGAGGYKIRETLHEQEVTELSEVPLARDLFVPPRAFRRVAQLPDGQRYRMSYRMRLRWELFRDSLTMPRRIAGFIR